MFGSQTSLDRDVLVLVPKLPSIEESKRLCKELNSEVESLYSDNKKANCNLAVVEEGVLTQVFKGTVDEVNNSLLDTYSLHEQKHPLFIFQRVKRDRQQKLLRVARIVLSFYSRSEMRSQIKSALKSDFKEKIKVIKLLDFSLSLDFDKNSSKEDIYKNLAFQFGQIQGLYEGKEFYAKESIAKAYPALAPYLNREATTLDNLEQAKQDFVLLAERELPNLTKLKE